MKLETLLSLSVPLLFFILLTSEVLAPARAFAKVPRWRWLGGSFFVATLVVGGLAPQLLPVKQLSAHSLFDLHGLGLWAAPIGLLATTFVGYWLHRAEHRYGWLWRATHQLHHSPVRVDMAGAYFAHPFEVLLKVLVSTLMVSWVLGLTPLAASVVNTLVAALSLFQHWNVQTPRALGFFVQRPESHCVHHAVNDEGHNYSELPLWDMLFGTFRNPAVFDGEVGLEGGARPRVKDMLFMRSPAPRKGTP
jgi:sterol desaturase/sphingolipid hydroxylase (fatty acid hydroxylase superfamily)